LPQQLSLDRLEEGFDRRVVVAVPSPTHGRARDGPSARWKP
jgi:hypothetical protein